MAGTITFLTLKTKQFSTDPVYEKYSFSGKNSRGMADEQQTREIKQASKQASLRAIITEGRGSQIKSLLIREAFKGKLVGLLGDEEVENI